MAVTDRMRIETCIYTRGGLWGCKFDCWFHCHCVWTILGDHQRRFSTYSGRCRIVYISLLTVLCTFHWFRCRYCLDWRSVNGVCSWPVCWNSVAHDRNAMGCRSFEWGVVEKWREDWLNASDKVVVHGKWLLITLSRRLPASLLGLLAKIKV